MAPTAINLAVTGDGLLFVPFPCIIAMPLYEYTCDKCDSEFELLIRSTADEPACPSCGAAKVTKRLSVPAAHSANSVSLPTCEIPPAGGCGRPQCGTSGCMGMGM
jgi:putative FmdB family regulatory protein